jgi:hypothetical protein
VTCQTIQAKSRRASPTAFDGALIVFRRLSRAARGGGFGFRQPSFVHPFEHDLPDLIGVMICHNAVGFFFRQAATLALGFFPLARFPLFIGNGEDLLPGGFVKTVKLQVVAVFNQISPIVDSVFALVAEFPVDNRLQKSSHLLAVFVFHLKPSQEMILFDNFTPRHGKSLPADARRRLDNKAVF